MSVLINYYPGRLAIVSYSTVLARDEFVGHRKFVAHVVTVPEESTRKARGKPFKIQQDAVCFS